MKSWFAVHTQPRREFGAESHLSFQGFDTYLPKYVRKVSHARKIVWKPFPLFPRYLFVGFDVNASRWRSINSTTGVANLVSFGSEPSRVSPDVLKAIKSCEGTDGYIAPGSRVELRPGDEVTILDDVFSDAIGIVDEINEHGRVKLLLQLLGRAVRVSVPANLVTKY